MRRRRALVALAALAACARETARPDRASVEGASGDEDPLVVPRPSYREAPDGALLSTRPLARVRVARERSPFVSAEVEGRAVLVLFGTRASPDRWRPSVAMSRLARRVSLDAVPGCGWRREPLAALLEAADGEARESLREAATLPDGRVSLAVTAVPARTIVRATAYSNEAAGWARLAASREAPTGAAALTEQSYVAMLALDYLAGNIFRRTVDEDDAGRLWLIDNRGAFGEHPEPRAVDEIFDRLKLVRRFPAGLERSLGAFDETAADEDFRAGEYESWLAQRRPLRELLVRARALRGLVASTRQ